MSFASLGLFILDRFPPDIVHIGGAGSYAAIGARIWLAPSSIVAILDVGTDFPEHVHEELLSYGPDMWHFRVHADRVTSQGLHVRRGDTHTFEYLTPLLSIFPRDLHLTPVPRPPTLHFICSPSRALHIVSELDWDPITIYEPIPHSCVPEQLPPLISVMPSIHVLSPNAKEAFALLSLASPVTRDSVQFAALRFLDLGVGPSGNGCVIIRCDVLGVCVATRESGCRWVEAFWTPQDASRIADVTGAGNSFLGGLAAGLLFENGDVYKAALYASVSASFVIEQYGLPTLSLNPDTSAEQWNGDSPRTRLEALRQRQSGPQG